MKLNTFPKLIAAILGCIVGFHLPEIWVFLVSLFS